MKNGMIALLLAASLLAGCAHLRESDVVDPVIHGEWTGQGRFYDRDLNAEYGKFPLAIEVHPDNTVTGTVGGAKLADGVIKSRRDDFLIEAKLTGEVLESGSLPDENKDSLVLIVSPPDGDKADGDFHLKTNLTFDFSMRAGEMTLTR
jgi:hypothetical protein